MPKRTPQAGSSTEFSALLKRFRTRAGLSQQLLADRALVSVQAVSALERGYRRAPYRKTLDRLADALSLLPDARATFEEAAHRARETRLAARLGYPNNLPRQLTSFVGGEEIVRELGELLATAPLVSVVGTGGAGKTRAAIEVGSHVLSRFPDGVWFVELAPLADPSLVAHALAGALRVQESPRRSMIETIVSYLEGKRLLVVLDNCEHAVAATRAVVGSLLRECATVNVLVTSRESLSLAGERVYRVPPLAIPPRNGVTPEEAISYGSVALFADRARGIDARFSVTPENVSAIVEICRRLDGLPLALELAAARTTVLSPAQIAGRLDRLFDLLNANGSTTISRHQTMRGAIDWSYGLLSVPARRLFDRVSGFAGGFSLESVTDVCSDAALPREDVLELLTSLVTRSLVTVDFSSGEARYQLLECTRQYGLEQLGAHGERETLANRHARAFLARAQRLDADWYRANEREWFREAVTELDDYRAALQWSLVEKHDLSIGRGLAGALARVWYSLSPVEGRRWVRAAIEATDERTPVGVVVQLHVAEAELSGALGEYKASLASAERALALLSDLAEPLQTARAKQAAGSALGALERGSDGEVLLGEALAIARLIDNRRLAALALGDLGTARSRRGDVTGARRFYAEALASYNALGLERPAASIAGHLAEVEFASGDAATALQLAGDARRGHELTHNRRSAANDLSNMAAYLVAMNRYDDALERASEALRAARDVKATVLTAYALQHVAAVGALRQHDDERRARSARERAAMLLGFVNARLESLEARREHTERQEYDRMRIALDAVLDGGKLRDLAALGAAWNEDEAASVALES